MAFQFSPFHTLTQSSHPMQSIMCLLCACSQFCDILKKQYFVPFSAVITFSFIDNRVVMSNVKIISFFFLSFIVIVSLVAHNITKNAHHWLRTERTNALNVFTSVSISIIDLFSTALGHRLLLVSTLLPAQSYYINGLCLKCTCVYYSKIVRCYHSSDTREK